MSGNIFDCHNLGKGSAIIVLCVEASDTPKQDTVSRQRISQLKVAVLPLVRTFVLMGGWRLTSLTMTLLRGPMSSDPRHWRLRCQNLFP